MRILYYLFRLKLRCSYFILKKFKIKNRILFLSRQSNSTPLDFKMLIDKIGKENEVIILTSKINKNIVSYLKNYLLMFKQMYYLATSKVCIIDGYNPVISVLKHKDSLKVIQLWHSLGAIKKFGYQTVGTSAGRKEDVSKIMCMHKNYDYIISGSSEMSKYFMEAFGYEKNKFYNYGSPKIDYLLDNKDKIKNDILERYPEFLKKENILYAPTFRVNNKVNVDELLNKIDFNKYNLIIKNHPLQKIETNNNNIYYCEDFSAFKLLTITDHLITDYSGIAIEAASLDTKTYYYVYDYEEYKKDNGLNINLFNEMPKVTSKSAEDIIKAIDNKNYDYDNFEKYKSKYVSKYIGHSTEKIYELIKECLDEKINS